MGQQLRIKLLNRLITTSNKYTSGQRLADMVGCSRTAIWKQIEQLRKDGYEIDAVQKKGYKLIRTPDTVTPIQIQTGLQTKQFGGKIHYKKTVNSTQKIAGTEAINGATEGTIVIAEEQKEGRGRLDRNWESVNLKGVYMSIILRPKIPIQKTPQLTLLTAVALVQAIEEATELVPSIKWPNDILINNKKVAGILTELQAEADKVSAVIIGVGINVNQASTDFTLAVKDSATSLKIESEKSFKRASIIQSFLLKLEKLYEIYLEKGFEPIKLLWESYSISIGKIVTATTIQETITGFALCITDQGALKLKDDKGNIHNIYSADISI